MKHLSIPANQTSINFDNVFIGVLPDLVIVGLVSDADLAGGALASSSKIVSENLIYKLISIKNVRLALGWLVNIALPSLWQA